MIPLNTIKLEIAQNGILRWWVYNGSYNRLYHNNNGPAFASLNGYKLWWVNGFKHRLDGPAIEYADGLKDWFVNGKEYDTEFEYWFAVQQYNNI